MVHDGGAVGQVDLLCGDAVRPQHRDRLLEQVDLTAREGVGRVIGDSQVGERTGDPHVPRGALQNGRERRHVGGRDAQAAHAGIHLEVRARRAAPLLGGPGQRLDLVRAVQRGHQVVTQHELRLGGREAAEDQDRRTDPRPAKLDAFLGDRHAEPLDPFAHKRAGDTHGAVAVGVGLHDREHRPRPDSPAHRRQIVRQGVQVDLGPGGPVRVEGGHHPDRCSSSSNRVYSRRNAMLKSPVGPLRCLAMIRVAMPRFSSVGL